MMTLAPSAGWGETLRRLLCLLSFAVIAASIVLAGVRVAEARAAGAVSTGYSLTYNQLVGFTPPSMSSVAFDATCSPSCAGSPMTLTVLRNGKVISSDQATAGPGTEPQLSVNLVAGEQIQLDVTGSPQIVRTYQPAAITALNCAVGTVSGTLGIARTNLRGLGGGGSAKLAVTGSRFTGQFTPNPNFSSFQISSQLSTQPSQTETLDESYFLTKTCSSSKLPPPRLGKTVDVAVSAGVIFVKRPGGKGFVRLKVGQSIPLGSTVDATRGTVSLTAATDNKGHTVTGQFYAGVFRLTQTRSRAAAVTVLTLAGPKPQGCQASGAGVARRRPRKRRLWGQASGGFRTVGSYASATERGTKWLTQDTCAGTLVKVTQGSVNVDDFPHHRTVQVRAGHSFLAHPGKGG
jgi:hypothetical protein